MKTFLSLTGLILILSGCSEPTISAERLARGMGYNLSKISIPSKLPDSALLGPVLHYPDGTKVPCGNISIDEGGFEFDCLIREEENGGKYEVILVSDKIRTRFTFSEDFFAASYPMGNFDAGEPIAFFVNNPNSDQPSVRLTIEVYANSEEFDQGGGINSVPLRSTP